MICYKDMTFCSFWEECKEGKSCPRALTEKVEIEADRWWLSFHGSTIKNGAPICQFVKKPECFK